jgi:hypothetical protein
MKFGDLGFPQLVTVLVTGLVVIACVVFHYEGLSGFDRWLKVEPLQHRSRIVALIFGNLALHIAEIWLWALAYFLLLKNPEYGAILPGPEHTFLDLVYLSAATYTTIGFGDLVPAGAVRFLCGMEALLGLVLITWSASFTFLEMRRFWGRD